SATSTVATTSATPRIALPPMRANLLPGGRRLRRHTLGGSEPGGCGQVGARVAHGRPLMCLTPSRWFRPAVRWGLQVRADGAVRHGRRHPTVPPEGPEAALAPARRA